MAVRDPDHDRGGRRNGPLANFILRHQGGATAIEFAIVAPALIALLLAILMTTLLFFTQQTLQTAAEAAARSIITGKTQLADAQGATTGMSRAQLQERFRKSACAAVPNLSCPKLMVDVQSASTFRDINTTIPAITLGSNGVPTNSWNYDTGGAGSIVIVRLMYIWPVPAGPLGLNLSNVGSGQRLLIATSVAKSEAYNS